MLARDQHDQYDNTQWSASGSIPALMMRNSFNPPHLYAVGRSDSAMYEFDPAATQPLPSMAIVELRFPSEVVQRYADAYAQEARAQGSHHSLRLWKASYEKALIALVHASRASAPGQQPQWELLSWQQDGDSYLVSITFTDLPMHLPTIH